MTRKILTIDDSITIRQIITTTFGDTDCDVIGAESPRKALQILKKIGHELSLIILDINMPDMDGLEFLENIKAIPLWAEIPVIMLTTESKRDTVLRAVRAGATNYLVKPFTKHELIEKVHSVLA